MSQGCRSPSGRSMCRGQLQSRMCQTEDSIDLHKAIGMSPGLPCLPTQKTGSQFLVRIAAFYFSMITFKYGTAGGRAQEDLPASLLPAIERWLCCKGSDRLRCRKAHL